MNRLNLIYSLLLFSVCFACSDNEDLKPSGFDQDWFAIENDPRDPLKSLVYDIYVNQKVSVFYNDTIGKSIRGVDEDGNPVVHYQILMPQYTIDGINPNYRFVPSQDKDIILNAVRFLNERVLSMLTGEAMPKSYFLVDSVAYLEDSYDDIWGIRNTYKGMMTTVCGRITELSVMSEAELRELAVDIIALDLGPYICATYKIDLEKFYLQTNTYAGKNLYGLRLEYDSTPSFYDDLYEYGFIRPVSDYNMTPTEEEGVSDYVKAVLFYSEEEFTGMYEEFDVIMAKYAIMKRIMDKYKAEK